MSINLTPSSPTYPTVTIQFLVFTAKRFGQFPSITYVNGGTAGSELVTVDSSFNITVRIANGVSTNTQIAAAVNAATQSNGLGAGDLCSAAPVSGHESDTPTCFSVALAGGVAAVKASLSIGRALIQAAATGAAGNSTTLQLVGNVPLTIGTVTDGTHLVITSNALMVVGATLTQGAVTTTITTVTDATHIIVADTTGLTAAAATTSVTAGNEKVKVTSAAVLVQIQDGVSTWDMIRIAVAASGAAAALMVILSNGRAIVGATVTIANTVLGAATNLAGGVTAAAATTGAVNGLTVNANATGVAANGVTVTLIPGATAGAEVVTDLANGSFTVQIESGVSSITQVRTALNADTVFAASYTAVGTSATAMKAVYQNAMTGASGPKNLGFYMDNTTTTLTTSFQWMPFGNNMTAIHVENDDASGNNTIIGSWDGVNTHFVIPANTSREFTGMAKFAMYLKYGTGAPAYRAWATVR